MFCHQHVVVGEKNHPGSSFRAAGKLKPLPDHVLALGILGMCLARQYELHGTLLIIEDAEEACRIVQKEIRALVRREAARKSESQNIVIEYECCLRQIFRRCRPSRYLTDVESANVVNQNLAAIGAELPKIGVARGSNILHHVCQRSAPTVFCRT